MRRLATPVDWLILVLAVIVSVTVLSVLPSGGDAVTVRHDGVTVGEYKLNTDTQLSVDGVDIIICDGKVSIIASDCSGGQCTHSEPIGKQGGSIICLPNRVSVTVGKSQTDGVTY